MYMQTKTKKHSTKIVDYFYISLILAIVSLFGTILANFLPAIYFSSIGYPEIDGIIDYDAIHNDKIFVISAVLANIFSLLFIAGFGLAVYFAIKRHEKGK